jgi:hypothetical protein
MSLVSRFVAAGAVLAIWIALQLSSAAATMTACAARSMDENETLLAVGVEHEPVELRSGAAEIPLRLVRGERDAGPAPPLSATLRDGRSRAIYLTFVGVTVQAQPGVSYNVYLNRPADERGEGAASPHFVGALSLFNATRDPSRELALNVTAPLQRLLARGELDGDLRLTIAPAGTPDPAASPRIARVRLVAR